MPRAASLTLDEFYSETIPFLEAQGFVITGPISRYDPTHAEGLTPSGKVIVLDITSAADSSMTCVMRIATNTRQRSINPGSWDAATTRDIIMDTWRAFPANQR